METVCVCGGGGGGKTKKKKKMEKKRKKWEIRRGKIKHRWLKRTSGEQKEKEVTDS